MPSALDGTVDIAFFEKLVTNSYSYSYSQMPLPYELYDVLFIMLTDTTVTSVFYFSNISMLRFNIPFTYDRTTP